MASNGTNGNGSQLLVVNDVGGITVIDPSTPLRRLNYFDGKFLRASDFDIEQSYLRELVALSNQGMGAGVVYGYDTTLGNGDTIQIGPGLAIDPSGKVLLMQATVTQSIQALIDASKKLATMPPDSSGKSGPGTFNDCIEVAAPPPTTVISVSDIYVIAICSAEALCGQADVYGKLCEEACVTSTDRPYRLDGVVLRAIPLQLVTPFPTSKAVAIDLNLYLRSKVAHSWFGDEVLKHPNAISRAGLLSTVWCLGAGYDSSCCEVPLAVVARSGATTIFLDAWIVRRERMEAPSRRYWQWKMMMRPWDVFLAQILQFQCQLAEAFEGIDTPGRPDPCAYERQALGDAAKLIEELRSGLTSYRSALSNATTEQPALMSLSLTRVSDLHAKISTLLSPVTLQSKNGFLIDHGFCEMPPAGYLPVMNGTSVSVNDQVRALVGNGLDLRFCIASADFIAHEVEKAQHMDRISLLQGLDDPTNKPHVDIIVPDGKIAAGTTTSAGGLYDAKVKASAEQTGGFAYQGAAREEALDSNGTALYVAGAGISQASTTKLAAIATALSRKTTTSAKITITPNLADNAFVSATAADTVNLNARVMRTAMLARTFTARTNAGLATPAPSATSESADGFWLTGRVDKSFKTLAVGTQTPLSVRFLLGTHPATPTAFELMFNGKLSLSSVTANGQSLSATISGLLTLGAFKANQATEQETDILFIERVTLDAAIAYTGDDQNGSVAVTLKPTGSDVSFTVTKTYAGSAHITYDLSLLVGANTFPFGNLDLIADPNVIDPANPNHVLAESGLDIVQASLIESEPTFQKDADAELFPNLPPATQELVIQAVRDWVMFTKRREETCAFDVVPTPQLPPRRYQVINVTAKNATDAQRYIEDLTASLQDPSALAALLKSLLESSGFRPSLIVEFAGGSATATSDLAAAEADWRFFNPGDTIYLAAAGANGETSSSLQLSRIKTFEGAITADSNETPGATELAMLPFPAAVIPKDADGIMLFITASTLEQVHVFGTTSADVMKLVQTSAAEGTNLGALDRFVDLGIATASGSGNSQTVTDKDVVDAFNSKFPNSSISASMMISKAGDATDATNNRVKMSAKVVTDIDSKATAPAHSIYPPAGKPAIAFPVTDSSTMLFLRVLRRRQG